MNTGVLVVLGEQNVNDVKPAGCVQPLPGCKCLVMPGWHGPLPQPSRAWRDVSLVSRKKMTQPPDSVYQTFHCWLQRLYHLFFSTRNTYPFESNLSERIPSQDSFKSNI